MDRINAEIGLYDFTQKRTLRLKGLVKIRLPKSLRSQSSMFFCIGPHCMFSNMGDGNDMITYAPVTNISQGTGLTISKEDERRLQGESTPLEEKEYAKKVIQGVSRYIPDMKHAEVTGINYGVIKTEGSVDVFSADSDVHNRDYPGVKETQVGVINNSSMKLLYFLQNAEKTTQTLEKQFEAKHIINKTAYRLTKPLHGFSVTDIRRSLEIIMERNFSSDDILRNIRGISGSIQKQMERKHQLFQRQKPNRDIPSTLESTQLTGQIDSKTWHTEQKTILAMLSTILIILVLGFAALLRSTDEITPIKIGTTSFLGGIGVGYQYCARGKAFTQACRK